MNNDETMNFAPEDINATKGLGILCYLNLLLLVPLLVNKDSAFTKFHANQGLILAILSILSGMILGVIRIVFDFIPGFGIISGLLSTVVPVLLFVLMIIGIINVSQGQAKRLPIIGNIEIIK